MMVGSNRIVTGNKIVNPVGDVELPEDEEIKYRRSILERALTALQTEVEEPTVFEPVN